MGSIHKLTDDVINRIAAGEVVQRPSAALKELLENAIDAGCSRVQVVAAEGGLDVLQVSDDGSGIHKEDLPLLCERYATSKLQKFEDLHRVTSFGFRGEALASISYVSRVTVTTRRRQAFQEISDGACPARVSSSTAGEAVAWRCQYLNGVLLGDPQPCAGNPGTTIRAEKLFYNVLVRRRSFRASEEWGRIVDVVSRYALAFPAIGFTCHRDKAYSGASSGGGSSMGSLSRLGGGSSSSSASAATNAGGAGAGGLCFPPRSSMRQNIRLSHGSEIASHLRLVYAYNVETATTLSCDSAEDLDADLPPPEVVTEEGAFSAGDEPGSLSVSSSASSFTKASSSSPGSKQSVAQEGRVFSQMEQRARRVRATSGPAGEGLFTLVGYTSDPTLTQRKPYLCLFINQRLVESAAIRKAIDAVYSGVLTSGHRPFTVLLLSVPTDRVDVNVHPTKKEVCLLDEELILSRVAEVCRGAVLEAAAARQMDMLKMRHIAALALKQQLPIADGVGVGDDSAKAELSGSSSQHILEKLREQHQRGVPLASPLTSSSLTSTAAAASVGAGLGSGGPAVVVAPCTIVRVEPQRGALDKYFSQRLTAAAAPAPVTESVPTSSESPFSSLSSTEKALSRGSVGNPLRVQEGPLKGEDMRYGSASEQATKGDTSSGQPQTAATYEAPSWEAVMASLNGQRGSATTAPKTEDEEHRGDVPLACSQEATRSDAGHVIATHATQAPCDAAEGFGKNGASLIAAGGPHPTEERTLTHDDGNAKTPQVSAAIPNDSPADDDDDEAEDDGMREFKRHRHEVHARAQFLQGGAGTAAAAAAAAAANAVAAAGEEAVLHVANCAPVLPPTLSVPSSPTAEGEKAQGLMARLGAVVRASDMLRGEAAAEDASHFAHTGFPYQGGEAGGENGLLDASRDGVPAVATGSLVVHVDEVPAPPLLSSVSIIVERLLSDASPTADNLVGQLSFVGVVDSRAFLAQAGTTLLWCDTMALVRHAIFQRIFFRWVQPALPAPPLLTFTTPILLADLLLFALAYDGPHLQPTSAKLLCVLEECARKQRTVPASGDAAQPGDSAPTADAVPQIGDETAREWQKLLFTAKVKPTRLSDGDPLPGNSVDGGFDASVSALRDPQCATMRYVRRLVRRLCHWRGLLKEYFYIDITADGLLVGLPYGLNRHWPPRMRAVPVLVWLLAEAVPYPGTASPSSSTTSGAVSQASLTGVSSQYSKDRGAEQVVTSVAAPTLAASSVSPTQTATALTTTTTTNTSPLPPAMEDEADGVAQEVACFTAVARHISDVLYSPPPPPPPGALLTSVGGPGTRTSVNPTEKTDVASPERWAEELVQYGLFPCLKNSQLFRLPDHCMRDGTIQSLVSVESLYKVFERC
ncbi:hypothetical protein JKF63_05624 [Porcisia hertigi]|uniref:DNA mismatch repair protein S5 domain-containing protein n=1 Tax=Porcisia hertigi TaxID=2761500 RepID=A0A836ITW1_9TRYP|nr:hypothetical protein JKF63_05624 [Porcisia hertigi]